MPEVFNSTLVSSSGDGNGRSQERLVLVSMGSPELGFVHGGTVHPLTDVQRVRFGRSVDASWDHSERDGVLEIAIPLPWVSSVHAELRLEGTRLRIIDMGSRNGTLIEGDLVDPHAPIGVGRVFEIGRSFWMLRLIRRTAEDDELGSGPGYANAEVRVLQRAIARLAPTNVPILLTGETGTGKERLARAIHVRSGRSGPFVAISVAAGSVERMLYDNDRLRAARGGTLYLDDVGELPPEEQTKLTSALMSHGPSAWRPDARDDDEPRFVSSTARNLRGMVETGAFRPDLLGRLAGYEARLPPLRARREDLGLLAMDVLRRHSGPTPVPLLSCEVFRAMLSHSWPFNLRELEHSLVAARSLIETDSGVIDQELWEQACWTMDGGDTSPSRVEAVRRELVQQLARHRGQLPAVAAALRCELEDVRRWTERFSLHPDRYRDAV